ncbi:MAG: rhomboid family intramembrane serine protease [Victivallales bacterium]
MNTIIKRSKWALCLIAFFVAVYISNSIFNGKLSEIFSCHGHLEPLECYRLLTYFCLHGSFLHLAVNSLSILMLALILEPRLPGSHYIIFIASSVIIGGILFSIFNNSVASLIGSGLVKTSMVGGVIACWFKFKTDFNKLERIFTYILLASLIVNCLEVIVVLVVKAVHVSPSDIYIISWIIFIYGYTYLFVLGKYYRLEINKQHCDQVPPASAQPDSRPWNYVKKI